MSLEVISRKVKVQDCCFSNQSPFVLIGGPCQIESQDHAYFMAKSLQAICAELKIPYVFKASFDKANRTSVHGARGIGLEAGAEVFQSIRQELGLPIVTDVHDPAQCQYLAKSGGVDILQIPAFLSRQTDLLLAAGETGLAINVKKGQFLAPWDMKAVVEKLASTGNERILVCERGTSFGYNALVNDFKGYHYLQSLGFPVVFDATHSVQQPGGLGNATGGERQYVVPLAKAALAIGSAALFIESHDKPEEALSDGPNSIPLSDVKSMLRELQALDNLVKAFT